MNTTKRTTVFGVNKRIAKVVHSIMLFGMLHSTFVAPAQIILLDYFHASEPPVTKWGTYLETQENVLDVRNISDNEGAALPSDKSVTRINKVAEVKTEQVYYSDIEQGFIGLFSDKPLDDAKDNLFKFNILNIPQNAKGYLKYDLYGVEGISSVSRSINDLPSTGGHIIKTNNAWSSQVEEIDINWLKEGENTILFTAPSLKEFGYKVKNLRIEFAENIGFNSSMVLNIDETTLLKKDNKIYVKGFINNAKKELLVEVEGIPLSVYQNQFEGVVELSDNMLHKKHLLIVARDNNGVLGQEVISLINLIEADLFVPFEVNSNVSLKTFNAFRGSEFYIEGAGIIVPDSALVERKNISISKLRKKDIAPLNSGMINVTKDGAAFRFLPDGTKFQKEAKVLLEYDPKLVPSGYSEKDIKTFYFNTKSKTWVSVEKDSVDLSNKMIISKTDHFTDYINGIIQTPETPESSAFIPTMMSDIQAADPSAGITLIAPPEVSQKGSAGISYPIKVPAGRKGMQPNLAIQYNSDGGNGFLGQGWDISIPAITIDTRWGVPILDNTKETEIYTLNGEQLMYPKIRNAEGQMVDWMPNRHYDATSDQNIYSTVDRDRINNAVFTPRKQGSFVKIERLGTNLTNYYWKVTGTDGTISWYGGKTAVVNNSVLRNAENKIVYWSLYMVEDVFGNTMRYNYTNVNIPGTISGVNANLQGGKYFHIRNIYYTGYNGSNEGYSVDFNPTSTSSTNVREDVTIDSRLGIKLINSKRLSNIQIKQGSQVIRRYNLNYEFSKFQKYRVRYIAEANGSNQEFYRHEFEYYDDLNQDGNDIYFSSGVDIDTCEEDEFEAPEPCYYVHPPNNALQNEMAYIYYNGIPLQGNPFYLGNMTTIVNALNAQFPGTFSYLNINGVNRLMITNLEEIPQTMTFIVNGEVFTSNFSPCPKHSHRLNFSGGGYSYNFSNSFPVGDPDCPSMVNAEFLIEGLIPSFNSYFSPLGSSSTKSDSFGGYIGLIGAGCNWVSKNTTAGFGYNKSGNKTKSEISMVDINGDGLNDIVIQEEGTFKFRPHIVERTYDENGEEVIAHSFGSKRPISGISNFYNAVGESEQYNFSFNSYVSLGWEKSSSKSTTNVYFTDANGDGLIDIVKNGVVYFNRLNANGNPHFYTDSKETENMVILAEPLSVEEPQEEETEFILPSYDVVKVWEAPADGNIKIENNIQLTDLSKEAVVTIEMKPSEEEETIKCYTVSFPIPIFNIYHTSYSYIFSKTSSDEPLCFSSKLQSLNLSGQVFSIPNLYIRSGNINGADYSDCIDSVEIMNFTPLNAYSGNTNENYDNNVQPLLSQISSSFPTAYDINSNISVRDYHHLINGELSYTGSFWENFNMFSPEQLYLPLPNYNVEMAYEQNTSVTSGGLSDNSQVYNFNSGNVNVHINGNPISPEIFSLGYYFNYFKTTFENLYSGSIVTIDPLTNIITITINNTTENFESIKLLTVGYLPYSKEYNFTQIPCSEYGGKTYQDISLIKDDWKDYKPSKEELIISSKRIIAEGNQLNLPITGFKFKTTFLVRENDILSLGYYSFNKQGDKEYWTNDKGETITTKNAIEVLNKLLPTDINEQYVDLQKQYEIEQIKFRKKTQQQAQEWLKENDVNKSYNKESYTTPIQKSFSSENNCGEIGDLCLLFEDKLKINNQSINNVITSPSIACNQGNDSLRVKKGDRIYFRVHSVEKGNPPINWDPKVSYTESQYSNVIDQNGYNVYSSNYSDGFILSESHPFTFPGKKGDVAISWVPFNVYQPSDNVTFKIIKRTVSAATGDIIPNSETELYKKNCISSNPFVQAIDPIDALVDLSDISIPETDNVVQFLFIAESTSNVKWAEYYEKWKPVITTTVTENVIGENNQPEGILTSTETYYPIIDYSVFKQVTCGPIYTTFDLSEVNGNISSISPNISSGIFTTGDYGKINFVVKNNNKLINSRVLTVTNGSVSSNNNNPILLQNLVGTKIEIGYYVVNDQESSGGEILAAKLASANNSTVNIGSYSLPNDKVNIYHRYNRFGPMYRQWGQFFYDPSKVEGTVSTEYGNLIKEEVLFQDYNNTAIQNLINFGESVIQDASSQVTENGIGNLENDLTSLQNQYEALIQEGGAFLMGRASRGDNSSPDRWIGLHEENYASQSFSRAASFSQVLSSDYEVEPYNYQGMLNTSALGINKIFRSKGKNISGGGSYAGFGVSASKSIEGSGKIVTDYTDLNGDRYPDIVTTEKVQFTTRTGGLKKPVNRTLQEEVITINRNDNFGFGVSGGLGGNNNDQGAANSIANKISKIIESTKPNTSIGLSANFSKGNSFTDTFWTDVNGDGLPDLIKKNGNSIDVYLNRGGKLESTPYGWNNLSNVFESNSTNIGGGIGLSLWNSSVQGGVSLTSSWNNTKNTFIDINGDGLVDFVDTDDNLGVRINTGNRFLNEVNWSSYDLERESVSATASKNFALTIAPNFGIPLTSLCIKAFAITGSYTRSTSTNKTMKTIIDFDGDGYPDLIEKLSESGTKIRVYHSRIRRTDKLKSVTNPLGGKFTVDYKVHKVDYDNPNPKWVMSSVEIEDGYDGLVNDGHNTYKKEFIYENPRYDRRERDFYGFETVKTIDYTLDENGEQDEVYRTSVTKYHNRSYFLNGLVKETAVYKGDMENNELYSKSENIYEIRSLGNENKSVNTTPQGILPEDFDVGGSEGRRSAAVFLAGTKNYIYELGSSPIVSESKRTYDFRGRLMWYDHLGDPNDPNDDYKTIILYQENQSLISKNIINVPLEVYIWVDGQAKRKSRAENINLNTGSIGTIKYFYTENASGQVDLEYDQFGNIAHVEYPENDNSERMSYTYEYDTAYNKHVTKVTDAFGYVSETLYNFNFDVPTEVTDIAGNKTKYTYDSFGRMTEAQGPKEMQASQPYTIQFEYFPKYSDIQALGVVSQNEFVPVALTKHYDPEHPTNTIDTYTFIDGLARPVQVKKDITINSNTDPLANPTYVERMSVSGAVIYDEFGRAVKQYHPIVEDKHNSINFRYNSSDAAYFTQSIYDPLDRVVEAVDEEGNQSFMEYSVDGNLHKTRSVVQQNSSVDIISESFKDVNGRVVKTNNVGPQGDIITLFDYNAIGELLSYTDDMGMSTGYKYDLLGRKSEMTHPDRGTTKYYYDKASNLTRLETANLSVQGQYISYHYEYNRLKGITFPEMTPGVDNLSNVLYEYGIPSSGNQTGRLIFQQDASGIQEFEYGNMGEMVYNRRTVVAPSPTLPTRTFETHFEYDSWNRLQEMTYPDGETVRYSYDLGGNLNEIQGDMPYVRRIDYNHYGERTYIKYGNETETIYSYTPTLRRLDNLRVLASNNETLLNNSYEYDKVGNVENITNLAGFNQVNFMGGGYQHSYRYDNLNRLVYARGGFTGHPMQYELGNDYSSDYETSMVYNSTHGIVNKTQTHNKNGQSFLPNTYNNDYIYYDGTHRVKEITDPTTSLSEGFDYDLNGNIVERSIDGIGLKKYIWDEADRLRVLSQSEEILHHYVYDASGQRVLKASSEIESIYENGQLVDSNIQMGNYTSYPSAFLVVDPDGIYSKHYYAGTQRIAARMGQHNADEIFADSQPKSGQVSNSESTGNDFNADELKILQRKDLQSYLDKAGKEARLSFKKYKPNNEEQEQAPPPSEGAGTGSYAAYGATPEPADLIYYYHPDHLGTATYLTDINGEAYEFFLNLPFGETMAEQHSQTADYVNRWKFTGHELDRETGLYYAGARYYDPKVSIFISVDPLAEQASDWTPYRYGFNNPIVYTDPTGMFETRKEARQYRRKNDIEGRVQRNEEGGFSINDKKNAVSYTKGDDTGTIDSHPNDGVVESTMVGAKGGSVGQPGEWESIIPVWGSGKSAVDHYQNGNYWRGAGYTVLAITDVFLVKSAVTAITRAGVTAVGKTGTTALPKAVGAAPKGFSTVLQTGGHTLNKSTLKALGLSKEQGKIAIEGLKQDIKLPANFHGKIMGNGDLVHPHTKQVLGNLFDYLP